MLVTYLLTFSGPQSPDRNNNSYLTGMLCGLITVCKVIMHMMCSKAVLCNIFIDCNKKKRKRTKEEEGEREEREEILVGLFSRSFGARPNTFSQSYL